MWPFPRASSRSRIPASSRPSPRPAPPCRSRPWPSASSSWPTRSDRTVLMYVAIPKGFFPQQDTGFIQAITEAGPTVSFDAMAQRQQQLAAKILQDPDVASLSSFIGVDGTNNTLNSGRYLINLKPKDDRDGVTTVIDRLADYAHSVPGITFYLQPVQDL